MKNIVVITPTERESTFFAPRGIRVVHCGVGMAECAATTARLVIENPPDLVILAGIAGTYTDGLEVGETVVVASETIADLGRYSGKANDCCDKCGDGMFTPLFQKTYATPIIPKGYKAVRSNTVDMAGGVLLASNPIEANIENMEGAAFLAVCAAMRVPAMEVRTISNRVGECIAARDMEIATRRLAIDLEQILKEIASHPAAI